MDKLSIKGKESSRRRFTTSMLGAIAASPFLHILASGQSKRKKTTGVQPRIVTHDTPPPIIVEDGSLEIQTGYPLSLAAMSAPYRYLSQFGGMKNLSHIRVLDRFGSELHYEPRAKGSTIKIQLKAENGALTDDVTIKGGAEIEVTSQRIRLNEHSNHKPNAFRRHKVDHPGQGPRFRIARIEIINAPLPFSVNATTRPGFFSNEFRLLIWLEP